MAATAKKPVTAAAGVTIDPLLAAINEFRFGGDQYEELPGDMDEDAQAAEFDRLVSAPLDRLGNWTAPATTLPGALAALRLALEELSIDNEEPIAASMIRAVLGFLDGTPSAAPRHAHIGTHTGAGATL